MNKILALTDVEFESSLKKWPKEEKDSIWKLLGREIELQKSELQRFNELMKNAQTRNSLLEVYRYEQSLRDGEMLLERLQRRMNLCETHKQNNNGKPVMRSSPSSRQIEGRTSKSMIFTSSSPSPHCNGTNGSTHETQEEININTKSLINNFEKLAPTSSSDNKSNRLSSTSPLLTKSTGFPTANQISMDSPRLSSSSQNLTNNRRSQSSTSNDSALDSGGDGNYYSLVKLKKVGLPADAQKTDQDMYQYTKKPIISFGNENNISKPALVNAETHKSSNIGEHSHSKSTKRVRFYEAGPSYSDKSSISTKNKFHNPNLEIRAAIEQEIKQVSLKPVLNGGTKSLYTGGDNNKADHVTLGKFDFSGEKHLFSSINNVSSPSLSASKSMPFLSGMSTPPTNGNSGRDTPDAPNTQIIEPLDPISSLELNKDVFSNGSSSENNLETWDPRPMLKNLYVISKHSTNNENNQPMGGIIKLSEYVDVFFNVSRGPKFSKGFQRLYATVTPNELKIYENQVSRIAIDTYNLNEIFVQPSDVPNILDVSDDKGLVLKLKLTKTQSYDNWLKKLGDSNAGSYQIVPSLYESVSEEHERKILIVDLGSCSVRAGILKTESTLPSIYMPHLVAIDKSSGDALAVGFEACDPQLKKTCHITRLIKPDTTLEHIAFTSGAVEMVFRTICSQLKIESRNYKIMLSVPHNVSDSTRTKLADVLLLRLSFQGVSMCGQSLLALHAYGQPTGVLVDIGYRTEILPVTHGVVQNAGVHRSLLGGHLVQVALSHMLPFNIHSITDFFLSRHIMEQSCTVAKNHEDAYKVGSANRLDLSKLELPNNFSSDLTLQKKDLTLPPEGLFNPEIFSLDTESLPKLIKKSIMACPVDCRRDLMQSICLSGAATQFAGMAERLEIELKQKFHDKCTIRILTAPDRAHFSYVGACFVAASYGFPSTIVDRREWEDCRGVALKKWHF